MMFCLRAFSLWLVLFLAGPSTAQDLQGRDTASNWRGTHHSFHGIWNVICDERDEFGTLKQRCYIRWVDVYAERPKFGALFTFITPRKNAPFGKHDVMFGPEIGTVFLPSGFVIRRNGEIIWRMRDPQCLLFAHCTLDPVRSDEVLQAMSIGSSIEFSFVDPHLRRFDLIWSLEGFRHALETYEHQWQKRLGDN